MHARKLTFALGIMHLWSSSKPVFRITLLLWLLPVSMVCWICFPPSLPFCSLTSLVVVRLWCAVLSSWLLPCCFVVSWWVLAVKYTGTRPNKRTTSIWVTTCMLRTFPSSWFTFSLLDLPLPGVLLAGFILPRFSLLTSVPRVHHSALLLTGSWSKLIEGGDWFLILGMCVSSFSCS